MSTVITGLGSGFDINTIVSQLVQAKQVSMLNPLETKLSGIETKSKAVSRLETKFNTLQGALQTFTKNVYDSSSDIWAKSKIESSNESFASASSSGRVSAASVEVMVEQLATATIAKSAHSLGAITKESAENATFVNLANGQAKAGSFSMFLDGKEYSIEIEQEDTVKDVLNKINTVSDGKIEASVDDSGIFSIKSADGTKLSLGSSADTSNIVSALRLYEKQGENSYSTTAEYPVSLINTKAAMVSAESGLGNVQFFDKEGNPATSGKISVNGVEFEINEETTLDGLISKINGNSDANVTASYDSLTNRLILTSKQNGQSNISLSSDGTNLLNVLGLTEGTGEDEKIASGSQILGQNAIAYINGNRVVSTSNTITGEASGISNLSITLKKQTSDFSGNIDDPKSITLNIESDFSGIKESLEKFVGAYNDVVSTTKELLGSEGDIGSDSSLSSILNRIRNFTSQLSSNDGAFSMLAHIGISTTNGNATELSIDSSKLEEVLKEDFDSVKNLISDGFNSDKNNGLFDQLLDVVSGTLNKENGYFAQKASSLESQISSMNKRIEKANQRISSYELRITKQFNAMDATIASLNSQLSTFSSYIS